MTDIVFARGVVFDAEKHEYWYGEKRLSGITGVVSKQLGQKMPEDFVEEHRIEGLHVHSAVQEWITSGGRLLRSAHPVVLWITQTLPDFLQSAPAGLSSEVLVTDYRRYASAVDIAALGQDGRLEIFDIKKGVFRRGYVTWQLSVYKYLIEKHSDYRVSRCTCICGKDREYYPIMPKGHGQVEELLYGPQTVR